MIFTAHNIKLNGPTYTIGRDQTLYEELPRTKAIVDFLKNYFRGTLVSIVDLGCLEGGDSVALARAGFQVTGLEGRLENLQKCLTVQSYLKLPNLEFFLGDARTYIRHKQFDAVLSMGMLYHLDRPVQHIRDMVKAANHLVLIKGHYCNKIDWRYDDLFGRSIFWLLTRLNKYFEKEIPQFRFRLSRLTYNDWDYSYKGRWFKEHKNGATQKEKDKLLWASLDNPKSFWLEKTELMQAMIDAGCKNVFQLYLGEEHESLTDLNYGVFVGLK